uniref:OTU domain-containing protein n=1 Tax=Panagrellus redivivus TaxID=6233 RepID=A0A7E4VJM7_PANRE
MSDDETSPLEALKATHGKERRELQAKITALKRQVPNSDKKKKKEVATQVEQMEKDLKAKQEKELAELEGSLEKLTVTAEKAPKVDAEEAETNGNEAVSKVSRKQKKQEKKQADQKRRAELAAEDEAAAATSRGQQETDAINEVLSDKKLKTFEIEPDGDCLYNAISHQLKLKAAVDLTGANIRYRAADYMRANADDFLPFLVNDSGEMLSEESFKDYIAKVEATSAEGGAWGGDAELRAISSALKRKIEIIQPSGQVISFGDEFAGKPLEITYHRYAYTLGEHYNSTVAA